MNRDVKCPNCGREQDIIHDDGYGYGEEKYSQTCTGCGEEFGYETTTVHYYDVFPTPCLNDGSKHRYRLTRTYPREFSQMEYSVCGERREMTGEERQAFGIGTREDYFKSLKNDTV
jgi:predicted RNA-binding Zn-ribbon protein involved in translation (DUF1610 family)